ncbi:MAG: polyhydroxyalkanoic acid synthase [Hyphomicrobiaceae bacterium]|nr:polyhydroxyalkanoic acid synthase [Hyphomicrobiaceae bacterium]
MQADAGRCDPLASAGPLLTATSEGMDRTLHFLQSRVTFGISPTAVYLAYLDWLLHLAESPGKRTQLAEEMIRRTALMMHYCLSCAMAAGEAEPCVRPALNDRRFSEAEWQRWPFNLIYQTFLLQEQWWNSATTGVRGVTREHERVVSFAARQLLDTMSPSNFIATNPVVLACTFEAGGMNLVTGWANLIDDVQRKIAGLPPAGVERYRIGENVATSPGRVVFRNELMELIQYEPATREVRPEPVLVVPAWIMKYYILDLSPENSLVRYLVGQGYTVFVISWRNPGPEQRQLGLDDYISLGVTDALANVQRIVPSVPVHAVGYCLGGTLLSIAAAALARGDGVRGRQLKTLTLLAAQVDFKEAGELMLFIDPGQLAFLDDVMHEQGYLDSEQMAGAFQMLRSGDLVWSRAVRHYLMGERDTVNDLMAWNADATRMPARMHAQYLRSLFLDNDLAEGRYRVDGKPVALTDIRAPIFAVGTETDHVSPWRSVYKIRLLTDSDVTFLLTSGGHNAGIVSPPGHPRRHYRIATSKADETYVDPQTWMASTPERKGSWWPEWIEWLNARSSAPVAPPRMGVLDGGVSVAAPGTYVYER